MSAENETVEEKVDQASETEQPEKSPSEPGGVKGALSRYQKAQAEKSAKTAEEKPEDKSKEEPCPTCKETVTEEELETDEKKEPSLWIVDKEGNRTPVVFKANGKMYTPDQAEYVLKQAGLGVHSNLKSEEANKSLEEFRQVKPLFDFLTKAVEEGRVTVDGKRISPTEKNYGVEAEKEEEDEDEETMDPEIKKLRKEVKDLKEHELKKIIKQARDDLERDISQHSPTYYAAYTRLEGDPEEDGFQPLRIWDLLSKHPEMGVEEAMRRSHESMEKFFDHVIAKYPKFLEKHRQNIITNYLKEQEEKAKAPVGPPSGLPAGTPVSKEAKDNVKGVRARIKKYQELVKERERAGQKS